VRYPHLGERVAAELARADGARQAGNHGQARVCARRAAGWALGGWPTGQAGSQEGNANNVYQRLRSAAADEALPLPVRLAAGRLTVRVDEAFSLPFDQDPADDAREIIRWRWPGWQPLGG
jgi:hypothetical protein